MSRILAAVFISVLFFTACRPDTYIPKPRGYYHVDFPQHAYQKFDSAGFPYSFEYPVYAKITQDSADKNPFWINVDFPTLGGRIYLSYKQITPATPLDKLLQDSYELSFYHDKKADYINTPAFHNKNNVSGLLYDVGGNAASAYQFFATDSTKNFLRGALYFNVTPNADSLRPINEFLKKDIDHMLQTLKFN